MTDAIAAAHELDVELPDGRRLHAYEAGDEDGEPVIVHHGTPGSGVLPQMWADDAVARGIRLVGYDRPGYGGSSRHPGRRVADAAADVAALADALGVDRFRTWGASGGGPHALACTALLPQRVIAAACLAGVAPYDADALDFLAGMGEDNVEEFTAALAGEQELRDFLGPARDGVLGATPEELSRAMASLLPPVDVAVLTGRFARAVHENMAAGLRAGYEGWLDDDRAFTSGWGFSLTGVTVPVLLRQGEQDLMVPFAHGQWLAAHLPSAEVALTPEDGHLTLTTDIGSTHRWLLEQH